MWLWRLRSHLPQCQQQSARMCKSEISLEHLICNLYVMWRMSIKHRYVETPINTTANAPGLALLCPVGKGPDEESDGTYEGHCHGRVALGTHVKFLPWSALLCLTHCQRLKIYQMALNTWPRFFRFLIFIFMLINSFMFWHHDSSNMILLISAGWRFQHFNVYFISDNRIFGNQP